jgi:hypothetical protein
MPDMRDNLPSMEQSYGDASDGGTNDATGSDAQGTSGSGNGSASGNSEGVATTSGHSTDGSTNGVDSGTANAGSQAGNQPGTRADGGMTGASGSVFGNGTLTPAEQVAILDRQLEQSTSDFDAMILEEQERQREIDRSRTQSSTATADSSGEASPGANSPYRDDVARGGQPGGMGGIGGPRASGQNPAIYEAPEDIPNGNDDDVVARQLREAAMREPDPVIRERLWNEYRKYKGLEIPE